MWLHPSTEPLTEEEVDGGIRAVMNETTASNAMESLTTGVFLVGLAIALGASSATIGLLTAIPFLGHLCQLPAVRLIQRLRNRRMTVMIACIIARSFLLVVAAAAMLAPQWALPIIVVAYAFRYGLGAVAACAWNSWMRDLVPQGMLGRFYGRAMGRTTLAAIVAGLGGGYLIDVWKTGALPEVWAYSIIYVAATGFGMLSVWLQRYIPEPRMAASESEEPPLPLRRMIATVWADLNYRRWVTFLVSWNFALNLAAPFFPVVMLTVLGYDHVLVIGITLLNQAIYLFALRVWGHYADRFSHKAVIGTCVPVAILCLFGWTFVTLPEPHRYSLHLVIALHAVMGVALAGITLCAGAMALKLAPPKQATAFIAVNSVLGSTAAGLGPLLGGLAADHFKAIGLDMSLTVGTGVWHFLSVRYWDFLFLFASVLGLYALHRLAYVEEGEGHRRRMVMRALGADSMRFVRSFSSMPGLRAGAALPLMPFTRLGRRRPPE